MPLPPSRSVVAEIPHAEAEGLLVCRQSCRPWRSQQCVHWANRVHPAGESSKHPHYCVLVCRRAGGRVKVMSSGEWVTHSCGTTAPCPGAPQPRVRGHHSPVSGGTTAPCPGAAQPRVRGQHSHVSGGTTATCPGAPQPRVQGRVHPSAVRSPVLPTHHQVASIGRHNLRRVGILWRRDWHSVGTDRW